jgi:hypothetical protein
VASSFFCFERDLHGLADVSNPLPYVTVFMKPCT